MLADFKGIFIMLTVVGARHTYISPRYFFLGAGKYEGMGWKWRDCRNWRDWEGGIGIFFSGPWNIPSGEEKQIEPSVREEVGCLKILRWPERWKLHTERQVANFPSRHFIFSFFMWDRKKSKTEKAIHLQHDNVIISCPQLLPERLQPVLLVGLPRPWPGCGPGVQVQHLQPGWLWNFLKRTCNKNM